MQIHISPYLPVSPRTSPHLPASTRIYPHLPVFDVTYKVRDSAAAAAVLGRPLWRAAGRRAHRVAVSASGPTSLSLLTALRVV